MTPPARPDPVAVDLEELRRLAELATPGPWELARYKHGGGRFSDGSHLLADAYDEPEREFIAAASPDTILRLLDLLDPSNVERALVDSGLSYEQPPAEDTERFLAYLREERADRNDNRRPDAA